MDSGVNEHPGEIVLFIRQRSGWSDPRLSGTGTLMGLHRRENDMTAETSRVLYHNDMSTCAAKVRIVLDEKSLDWQGRHMNLRAGETLSPEYLQLNPMGVVPTLVDSGEVLIESTLICEYLEEAYPEVRLTPVAPARRAFMRLWTKRLDDEIHAATGVISTCIAFRHQHLRKSESEREAHLAAIPNAERRERLRLAIELGMNSPLFVPAIERFRNLFRDMANALQKGSWLTGEECTLADLAYVPYVARLEHLGLGALLSEHLEVRQWADRLKIRESYQTAVSNWFNDGYLTIFSAESPEATTRLDALMKH